MVKSYSPLRYPGGKSKISDFMIETIKLNRCNKHYIEPFAGGAGVALRLLYENIVEKITINDKDDAIFSFWWAATNKTEEFCEMIENVPLTVEEWKNQRDTYNKERSTRLDRGFSAFYMNRTNRSGILDAGPIGGFDQKGNYKIDARFNKESLTSKIKQLGNLRDKFIIKHMDAENLIKKYIPTLGDTCFVYLDPPYYKKGPELYLSYYTHEDHESLSTAVSKMNCKWVVSYDNDDIIRNLYSKYSGRTFSIRYSVMNGRMGSEAIFFSKNLIVPEYVSIINGADRNSDQNIIAKDNLLYRSSLLVE